MLELLECIAKSFASCLSILLQLFCRFMSSSTSSGGALLSNLWPTVADFEAGYHPYLPYPVQVPQPVTNSSFVAAGVPGGAVTAAGKWGQRVMNVMPAFNPLYPPPTAQTQPVSFYPEDAVILRGGPPAAPDPVLSPYVQLANDNVRRGLYM